MNRNCCFIFFLFVTGLIARAQSGESLRHHIIIAIDKAGTKEWRGTDEVCRYVNRFLSKSVNGKGHKKRRLFEDGDLVSVLGFALNANQTDMSVFALPVDDGNGKFAYREFQAPQLHQYLTNHWRSLADAPHGNNFSPFSLISVAKPYSLRTLQTDSMRVNRTFIILITDHKYNGGDFYAEVKALTNEQNELFKKGYFEFKDSEKLLNVDRILEKSYDVEQYYFIKYLSTREIIGYYSKGYVDLYEYVPLQRNFSLTSAVSFPAQVVAKRLPDDSYEAVVRLERRESPQYKVEKLDVFLSNKSKPNFRTPTANVVHLTDCDTTVVLKFERSHTFNKIGLRAWVNLRDGFYNATIMSPSEESPVEMGRDGLNVLVTLVCEPDAEILNCIPLWGWGWWIISWLPWINNQYDAARFWSLLIPLVFFLLIVFYYSRPVHYKPKPKDFTIVTDDNSVENNK